METKRKGNNISDKVPDHVIESLARSLLPTIQNFYKTEEGQKAFKEWIAQKDDRGSDQNMLL
jgi:hypothetical protein